MITERYITGMERRNIQPGTQRNVYGLLRAVLLDAVRKGAIATDPTLGIKTRDYVPPRSIIPTVEYATAAARTVDFQLGLMITMMRGCGLRNGEARAVNVNNVIWATATCSPPSAWNTASPSPTSPNGWVTARSTRSRRPTAPTDT
jgi:hypothetical protein